MYIHVYIKNQTCIEQSPAGGTQSDLSTESCDLPTSNTLVKQIFDFSLIIYLILSIKYQNDR